MINFSRYIKKLDFFTGHQRSVKLKKHIIASLFIKGASVVIGFLMVRITLDYLDQTKYGIWLTLSSFLTWFTFFEVGLGNGLRNKLAEALAIKDYKLGKIYVSTTYAILTIIIIAVGILFSIANIYIDWTVILNTDKILANELSLVAFVVFGFFFLNFVLKLISIVLFADQRPAISNSLGPAGNLISLIIIYILTKTTHGSLLYLSWAISAVPVFILVIASIYFYKSDYKLISPSIKNVKLSYAKDLSSLGLKFFSIQIAGLVIYQSSNIIIAQFFGPSEVTTYNIAFKYFSIINMGFSIIILPFWSAFTDAWVKGEVLWIKNTIKKLIYFWAIISFAGIIMLIFADSFYSFWIGDKIHIPFYLSLSMLLYFSTLTFGGVFNMFINGVGKLKLQLILSAISAVIFILVAIIFIKFLNFGIIGLVLASIIANIEGFVIAPIQYSKLINNKAYGIWNE